MAGGSTPQRSSNPLLVGSGLVLVAVLLLWSLSFSSADSQPRFDDYIAFWSAGRVLASGGDPYSNTDLLRVQREADKDRKEPLQFFNPPWFVPLLLPL